MGKVIVSYQSYFSDIESAIAKFSSCGETHLTYSTVKSTPPSSAMESGSDILTSLTSRKNDSALNEPRKVARRMRLLPWWKFKVALVTLIFETTQAR